MLSNIYEATINSETQEMFDRETGESLDAIAVIPDHLPDLETLVSLMSKETAAQLARLAAWRAMGMDGGPAAGFEI